MDTTRTIPPTPPNPSAAPVSSSLPALRDDGRLRIEEPKPKEPTLEELCKPYTNRALKIMSEIMDDPSAPKRARLDAANMLLDRAWGKATQKHEMPVVVTLQDTLTQIAEKAQRHAAVIDAEYVVVKPKELSMDDLI